jgi:hypothetical protein
VDVIPIVALALVTVIFLAYVGFSRRADQTARPSSGEPVSGEGGVGGMWGERRN